MERVNWLRGVVPVATLALMGAGMLVRPPVLAAADPPWVPPPCAGPSPAIASSTGDAEAQAAAAWYRMDGVVDDTGTLVGQRLSLGLAGGATRVVDLPPEAFASGPSGAVVVVGADDGSRSRVALVDAARACATYLADDSSVVRSALLAPDGRSVVAHRVDRATRADLGVWRVPFDGSRAKRVLPAPGSDAAMGRVFTTELRWVDDGRLAVTACGIHTCRTRVADLAAGRAEDGGRTGPVVGVTPSGDVVAYEACGGFPCAVVLHDTAGGSVVLEEAAGRASLAGNELVFEARGGGVAAVDIATGSRRAIEGADGLAPVRDGSAAGAGASHRAHAALLAPDGVVGPDVEILLEDAVLTTPIVEVLP